MHRFDSPAINPLYGATTPVYPAVASRVFDGNIQCSTCHDQHTGASSVKGRQRTSVKVNPDPAPCTTGCAGGTMMVNQPLASANPKGYRVQVVTAGGVPSATFRVSNDNGISWWGWLSNAWTSTRAGRCLTCHSPHHADSNSLTDDLR